MKDSCEVLKLLIVDDHKLVRSGIEAVVATEPSIKVVGEAADGREAVTLCRHREPDVVLMDLVMPEKDGIQATREITETKPEVKVLVLTSFSNEERVIKAIRSGASGYLIKDATPEELIEAIKGVYRGDVAVDPKVAATFFRCFRSESEEKLENLTEREIQVLKLVAEGLSNEEIGERLYITERTARSHVSKILNKLNLSNRTQAALFAVRKGLVSVE